MRNEIDALQTMFGPLPPGFSAAIRTSLAQPVQRKAFPLRAVLIAAALVLLTTGACALAVRLGLWEAFSSIGLKHPGQVYQAIVTHTPQSATLGPLTFTLTETLSDPYLTYAACTVERTEESDCLIIPYSDIYLHSDSGSAAYAYPHLPMPSCECTRLNLPEGTTYLEAAELTGLPLYAINARLHFPDLPYTQTFLPHITWSDNGQALITAHSVLSTAHHESMTATLTFTLHLVSPLNGTMSAAWRSLEAFTFSTAVTGITSRATYLPQGSTFVGENEVLSVTAEQTACGIYFTINSHCHAEKKPAIGQLHKYMLCLVGEDGRRLSLGLSTSARVSSAAWPQVISWIPTPLDALPPTLRVTDYSKQTNEYVTLTLQP